MMLALLDSLTFYRKYFLKMNLDVVGQLEVSHVKWIIENYQSMKNRFAGLPDNFVCLGGTNVTGTIVI